MPPLSPPPAKSKCYFDMGNKNDVVVGNEFASSLARDQTSFEFIRFPVDMAS